MTATAADELTVTSRRAEGLPPGVQHNRANPRHSSRRHLRQLMAGSRETPKPDLYAAAGERTSFELSGDSATGERSAGQHAHPQRAFRLVNDAFACKVDGFLTRFAILCARKASSESPIWLHVKSRQ